MNQSEASFLQEMPTLPFFYLPEPWLMIHKCDIEREAQRILAFDARISQVVFGYTQPRMRGWQYERNFYLGQNGRSDEPSYIVSGPGLIAYTTISYFSKRRIR